MRFVKRSTRVKPKISLILLDWSVRESFHLLHYLGKQTVNRDEFEVVFIEYYSREAEPLKPFAEQVDTWVLLEMPEACIYHKHLMYNCGIIFSRGEIVVICDSDAMVKDGFIQTIIHEFEKNDKIVLHLDQFRNSRKDFYPFNYPSFEDVLGEGCINNIGGKTKGILDTVDPLHSRNYGACMCAKRADLIAIGGADEHLDYLGNICGPYEMTFRLVNYGVKEFWHEAEFLYHTWHPGQGGMDYYLGPHDGMNMSKTALDGLISKRILPLVENNVLRSLRSGRNLRNEAMDKNLVNKQYMQDWDRAKVRKLKRHGHAERMKNPIDLYRGFKITQEEERYYAWPLIDSHIQNTGHNQFTLVLESPSLEGVLKCIDREYPDMLRFSEIVNFIYSLFEIALWSIAWPLVRMARYLNQRFKTSTKTEEARHSGIGGEKQSLPSTLVEFYQQYKTGWLAAKQCRAYVNHWTNNLIANLYFMNTLDASKAYWDRPVLLTTSLYVQLYLTALMALKVLPTARIVRLKDSDEIKNYFKTLAHERDRGGLILERNIYFGHYGLVSSCPQVKDAFVV